MLHSFGVARRRKKRVSSFLFFPTLFVWVSVCVAVVPQPLSTNTRRYYVWNRRWFFLYEKREHKQASCSSLFTWQCRPELAFIASEIKSERKTYRVEYCVLWTCVRWLCFILHLWSFLLVYYVLVVCARFSFFCGSHSNRTRAFCRFPAQSGEIETGERWLAYSSRVPRALKLCTAYEFYEIRNHFFSFLMRSHFSVSEPRRLPTTHKCANTYTHTQRTNRNRIKRWNVSRM